MTRFDFLHAAPRNARRRVPPVPRAVTAAALVVTATTASTFGLQWMRLQNAERRVDALAARLQASDAVVRRIRTAEADTQRMQRTLENIARLRAGAALRANEIAWIGNHLPADAWLTSLRFERGGVALEGGARSVETIAAALGALQRDPAARTARLVSIAADTAPGRRAVRYAIRLEGALP